MKFATKIGLSSAAVSLIVGPLLGAAVFLEARSLLQERILHEQTQSAGNVMREIDTAMYRAYLDVSMIAADELLRQSVEHPHNLYRASLLRELAERERLTGPWRALMVFDRNGQALFGPKPLGKATQIAAYPINKVGFDHALQGELYYSGQIVCPQTGQRFVIFAAPVYAMDDSNKVVGVVVAQYLWDAIQQILDHVDPAARVYLLNHQGEVIGRRSNDLHPALRIPLLHKTGMEQGAVTYGIAASSSHGAGDKLTMELQLQQTGLQDYHGNGWVLMLEQPQDVVFAPISTMARNTALIVFFILLLQAALLSILGRSFLQPLDSLLKGVKRVAGGDFNEKLTVHNKDELGELAVSFNTMTEKLRERTQQLHETQEELVQKEKLAMLGQMAENVGNELRNPLGVMSNAVYYLQTVLPDTDDVVREYLDIIKHEIAGSEHIVTDLLDAVRTNPSHIAAVNIRELIGQILSRYEMPAGISVRQSLPETLPPVWADPLQIQQVLLNLIDNSIEAMPDGGTLEILVSENAAADSVVISVRDNGAGIKAEHLAKLFQPMFTTKSRGIGLGLVIVKNLVEANSGSVEVHSEVGQGTTVTIMLPAASHSL